MARKNSTHMHASKSLNFCKCVLAVRLDRRAFERARDGRLCRPGRLHAPAPAPAALDFPCAVDKPGSLKTGFPFGKTTSPLGAPGPQRGPALGNLAIILAPNRENIST